VQPAFAALVARKLAPGGVFHLATDWADYAAHMLTVLSHCAGLENTAAGGYAARGERPPSKYERRGARLGHGVWDLVFRRTAA
jgi:tRNA (guanine-N7-)-methyltransferase